MINLYVKFIVHSSYAKQVIVLKVADRRADRRIDGRTRLVTTIGIRQNWPNTYDALILFISYYTMKIFMIH